MKAKRMPVMIDADLYQRLKEYSIATDAPVARVVARGLTDWLDKTGRERLDVLMDLAQEN